MIWIAVYRHWKKHHKKYKFVSGVISVVPFIPGF